MYMKRCSTLPVIKEVQNKATTRDTITRVLEWLKKSHQETKQKKNRNKNKSPNNNKAQNHSCSTLPVVLMGRPDQAATLDDTPVVS